MCFFYYARFFVHYNRRMVVYIEYLIFDNMLVNTLIITITIFAMKKKPAFLRVFTGSVIGTIAAVIMPIINISGILLFLYKIAVSLIIVSIITKYLRVKEYFIGLILFYLISVLFGGIVYVLCNNSLTIEGYYTRSDINVGILALAGLITVYILRQASAYIFSAEQKKNKLKSVEIISDNGETIGEYRALIDTGNNLYYSGCPVIFISKKCASGISCAEIGKVTVNTVVGSKDIGIHIIPKLRILCFNSCVEYDNVYCAISEEKFAYYDIILHSSMEVSDVKTVIA